MISGSCLARRCQELERVEEALKNAPVSSSYLGGEEAMRAGRGRRYFYSSDHRNGPGEDEADLRADRE